MAASKICTEHRAYSAGCVACQADARMYHRDYYSDPEKRAAKYARDASRDRSGEHLRRSDDSKENARQAWAAKVASIPAPNHYQPLTEEQVALILSDMSAVAVAAMLGRSPQSIHTMRHKARRDPSWTPGGQPGPNGGGPKWTAVEDERLAAMAGMPNKQIAEALGRTYEAVKFRKARLRRLGLIPSGGQS